LTEAREQQTATGEILRVISRSPTDTQPVFAIIAESAVRLCGAEVGVVTRFDGEWIHVGAVYGSDRAGVDALRRTFPMRPSAAGGAARAIRDRAIVHIPDVLTDEQYRIQETAVSAGFRALLGVPMLYEGRAIGAITLGRAEPGAFSDTQVQLLCTFADQALIAVENVRLFKQLEERNRDLTTALDRQTATADVLRIIAQSPTELQPVLDAIAAGAMRLCEASDAVIERLEGDRFYNAAHAGAQMKGLVGLPLPLSRRFPGGRAVLDRRRVILDDIHLVAEQEYPDTLELLKLNTIRNDILDLSKIEAGRMDLDVAAFDLPSAIDDALLLMRERAGRRGIALERHVDERVGEIRADQRKVKQVLLNLLSNAVKFTRRAAGSTSAPASRTGRRRSRWRTRVWGSRRRITTRCSRNSVRSAKLTRKPRARDWDWHCAGSSSSSTAGESG
jgi:GAF domain-containing protein